MIHKNFHESLTNKKCLLLLISVGLIVSFNIFFNDFTWLDKPYIINNAHTQQFDIGTLITGSGLTASGYYRPLTSLYFALVYAFVQNQPFLFHFLQIIIHITNSFLVFLIFTHFFKRTSALFLSSIYLVHPITETLFAFISATGDALCMFFGLSAFLFTLQKTRLSWRLLWTALLLLCSLFAKESGVLFFSTILLFVWMYRYSERIYVTVTLSITLALYVVIRFLLKGFTPMRQVLNPIAHLSLGDRLLSLPKIIFFYIKNFFYPFSIGINHLWYINHVSFSDFYLPLGADVLFFSILLCIGWYLYKTRKNIGKLYVFFFLLFLSGLSFYFQIIPLDYIVAGRWFVFPMIGLLGVFGLLFSTITWDKKYAFVGMGIIITFLSVRTIIRNSYWSDDIRLFSHASQINDNFSTENNLSAAYFSQQNYKQALIHMQKSVELSPNYSNYVQEGVILQKLHENTQANALFEKAMQIKQMGHQKYDANTYTTLSKYLIDAKEFERADSLLDDAGSQYTTNLRLRLLSIFVEYKLTEKDEAITMLQKATTTFKNSPLLTDMYLHIALNEPLDNPLVNE